MSIESPTPAELVRRGSYKWTEHPEDVLAAWLAEMDYGLAPPIAQALHDAIDRHDTGYPYPKLETDMAEAAVNFWSDQFGWRVDPARVFPVPDVIEGLRRAIVHLTRPDSPVVLHTPVYFPFYSMVDRAGRETVRIPSPREHDGRHTLDLAGIDRSLAEGAGSVVLCNPWNPVGRSFTRPEIEELLEVVNSHSARLIVDEVHGALTYPGGEHIPAASIDPGVITVTSASKAWNIPGLKCAQVALTNDRDAETWAGYFTPEKVGVSNLGLIANAAAYSEGRDWLEEVKARLASNRHLLGDLIATLLPKVGYRPPEATYLAWLDFTPYGLDDPATFFLEEARVALSDGKPFGSGGESHVRLNYATTEEILTELVERMGMALG